MSNQNLDGVRCVYDAFATGDVPGVLAFLASDIEWTEAEGFPYAGTYRGPDAVLDGVFMRLGTEWEGYAAVPDEFIDAGDTVVVFARVLRRRWTPRGTCACPDITRYGLNASI